jgi:hypothetical protein
VARSTQTYAIRLAVEGGGQVKAELITVGGQEQVQGIFVAALAVVACRPGERLFGLGQEQQPCRQ